MAVFIVVSFLAGGGPRSVILPHGDAGAKSSANGSQQGAKQGNDGANETELQHKNAQWSVPPDPRCFLINVIREFYASKNPAQPQPSAVGYEGVASGPYYDAYRFAKYGCSPGEVDESDPSQWPNAMKTWGVPKGEKPIRFMIATVPDPVRSHLSLFFDRSMDAIEQGAQADHYLFSRARMPWASEEHDTRSDLNSKLAWEHYHLSQDNLPGLVIFRNIPDDPRESKNEEDLFVFVVGETPTGGIHKEQFNNALEVINDIRRVVQSATPDKLLILGPTFSGSLPSLNDLLISNEKRLCGTSLHCSTSVHSGTVTSYMWADWFMGVQPEVDFMTFQESDDYSECHFLSYVLQQKYWLSDIAELSEDETAYGEGSTKPAREKCDLQTPERDIVHLHFPREISRLRTAYQSELQQLPQMGAGKQLPRTTLPLNLEDSGTDEDTVPTYAHQQYPLSQESVMLTITTSLRAHHARFVLLKASDPIDLLFLTRFLRQFYPQGRIVTLGADLLYRREVEDDLLHGIMAITSYSLLPRADDGIAKPRWPSSTAHYDPVFTSSYSSGVYNAMLSFLPQRGSKDQMSAVDTPNSGKESQQLGVAPYTEFGWPRVGGPVPPNKSSLSPALWLTTLGRDSYWPVALLDTYPANRNVKTRLRSMVGGVASGGGSSYYESPAPQSWLVLNGVALVLVLYYLALMNAGSLFASSDACSMFAPAGNKSRSLVTALTAVMLMAVLVLLWAPWVWRAATDTNELKTRTLAVLVALAWIILAWLFYKQIKLRSTGEGATSIFWVSILLLLGVSAAGWWCVSDASVARLAMFRYIHATSGVSPMPGCLLLLAAGLWWSWYALQSIALFDLRRPTLPSKGDLEHAWMYSRLTEDGTRRLRLVLRLFPPMSESYTSYAVAYAIVVVGLFSWLGPHDHYHLLWTLEPWPFDGIYAFALLTLAGVMGLELTNLVLAWLELRKLLHALDGLFLRRTFSYIKGFSWQRLWSLGGGASHDADRALNRTMTAWRYLVQLDQSDDNSNFVQKAKVIDGIVAGFSEILQAADQKKTGTAGRTQTDRLVFSQLKMLRKQLAVACALIFNSLQETWREESGPNLYDAEEKNRDENEAISEEVLAREQFVALVYVNFIVTILLRLRTLVVTIAGLYVFVLLSLSLYPVEPKPILRPLLILTFFAIVAVVGWVYAQMHRDAILSRLTGTTPGELGADFYIKIGGFVVLPLISLLVSQFPDVNNFLFSWLQPALQTLNR